jgi:hypothetical protein
LGASSPHIPLQGAKSSITPAYGECRVNVAPELVRLHLEKTKLSGFARQKLTVPPQKSQTFEKTLESMGPVTYKEDLVDIRIVIFKENYPEDKLTEDEQDLILQELGRLLH